MARLLKPDGSIEDVTPADPKRGFTLDELYRLLDCEMVETITLADGIGTMVIDKEGKLKRPIAPVNPRATMLLHVAGGMEDDVIVGAALICSRQELR